MNQEELEILRKAKEIQLKQYELLAKQQKEEQRLLKVKRKQEKDEENKIKKIKLKEQLEKEAIKKEQFDKILPSHLEHIVGYNVRIKEAEIIARQAEQNVYEIKKDKRKFMGAFYDSCVHSFGSEYTLQYDTCKKCIYCDYEICTHEMMM